MSKRPAMAEVAALPHVVYRVFDKAGVLLYIGCTRDIGSRMAVHKAWGNPSEASYRIKLDGDRVETTEFPDFDTAHAAEIEAIRTEAPLWNREHNPTRWRLVKGQGWERIDGYVPPEPEPNPAFVALFESLGRTA